MSTKPSETIATIDPQQDWRPVADFRRAAHEAVDWVAEYLADTRRYPVTPKTKPGELVDGEFRLLVPTKANRSTPSSAIWIRRSSPRSRTGIIRDFSRTSDVLDLRPPSSRK